MTRLQHNPHSLYSGDRPVRSDFAASSGLSYRTRRVITLAVVGLFVTGAAFTAWKNIHTEGPHEIPTIQTIGSYKQKPDQPGGLDIPNQDVQVYHVIDGAASPVNAERTVEHMLPSPEQPVIKGDAAGTFGVPASAAVGPAPAAEVLMPPSSSAYSSSADDLAKIQPLLGADSRPVATTVTPPVVETPVTTTPAATVVAAKPAAPAAPMSPPKPVIAPAPAPHPAVGTNGKVIQLAAMPDIHAAAALAQKLQGRYQAVLGGAQLHTVRADLGAKGIYYRIQSQPLPEAMAQSVCATIKAQNAGCLIVKP